MATESNLQKIHVFPSIESYEQNQGSVGADDVALVPDDGGTVITVEATGGLTVSKNGNTYTIDGSGKAAASHNHSASNITSGTLPIARGGTGVSNMTGTDYTTNRPRGIVLQSSTPSRVPNGCIVGVYE